MDTILKFQISHYVSIWNYPPQIYQQVQVGKDSLQEFKLRLPLDVTAWIHLRMTPQPIDLLEVRQRYYRLGVRQVLPGIRLWR